MAFEYTREELRSQWIYTRLVILGSISVARLLITNARDLKKIRSSQSLTERYVRPPREYELPEFEPGMRECRSREKYTHPTRYCNSRAPQIVALAHQLGAYRLPDEEYARAVFEFVKEKVNIEMLAVDREVDTLRRGTGTCFHLISLFIALCRAGGLKARYKMFSLVGMIGPWQEAMINVDPLVQQWYNAMGYFLIEGEGEVLLEGKWIPAHVGPVAARQASAGIAISRLGEDAIGSWVRARPGTIMRLEAMPAGLAPASRMLFRISPASMERVNLGVMRQMAHGRKVLEEAAGAAAYDAKIRAQEPQGPTVDLEEREEIKFK
jgi:hypothetical protein